MLSTETDPVVTARCQKLGLPVRQGIEDKASAIQAIMSEAGVDSANTILVGNDLNDTPCFPLVGCALVPANAHPGARLQADRILASKGGYGAVREVCDLILMQKNRREDNG